MQLVLMLLLVFGFLLDTANRLEGIGRIKITLISCRKESARSRPWLQLITLDLRLLLLWKLLLMLLLLRVIRDL